MREGSLVVDVLLVLVVVLQAVNLPIAWQLFWRPAPVVVVPPVVPPNVRAETAVRQAFARVGLPVEHFAPDFDLDRAGKIHDVIYHASLDLGIAPPLDTVAAVVTFLATKLS